ncbi:MAG TPA: hypothetical protein VHT03_01410 [Rhizomicrobium sp.]|jgi:hypothetical protein|nr:hypothetical protein [Rhizomicrobium sp.]
MCCTDRAVLDWSDIGYAGNDIPGHTTTKAASGARHAPRARNKSDATAERATSVVQRHREEAEAQYEEDASEVWHLKSQAATR